MAQNLVSLAGQPTDKKSVAINENQQRTLVQALSELETRHKVFFIYESKIIQDKYVLSQYESTQKMEAALEALLKPFGLIYERIRDNVYAIAAQKDSSKEIRRMEGKIEEGLGLLPEDKAEADPVQQLASRLNQLGITVAVDRTVTGRVSFQEDGAPAPGVNVVVKGTSVGTNTDARGNYSITVPTGSNTLVFSFIGYVTQEINIGERAVVNVSLVSDQQNLDEVVVVAYGTQLKRDLSSSVTSLKAKDLGTMPVASVDALLQGKAAGVQVVQNSGAPGGEVFVRIRGTNTLFGDSRPLYVIDGVPMTNNIGGVMGGGGQRQSGLADLNPNDIESIEILKDAAASALYGSRASNGVVLITTKRGRTGEAKVTFDMYQGVQQNPKTFDLLNGQEFVDVVREARINSGNQPFNQLVYTGQETDWQNEVFRKAPIAQYNLSVSGGSDRLTSFASVGYFKQSGTLIGQEFERLTGRLNLDYNAKSWLKIGNSTTFTNVSQNRVDSDFSDYSVLANALFFDPNVPVRNEDGSWGRSPLPAPMTENPVMIATDMTNKGTNRRLITNLYGEISFLEDFRIRSTFGIDYLANNQQRYIPSYFARRLGIAEAFTNYRDEMVWQNENVLSYGKTIGAHSFDGLVGFSMLESNRSFLQAGGNTTASDIITTIGAIAVPSPHNHFISSWGLRSYFARANYTFNDKYNIQASIRRDGSSRFGKNYRFGLFPSVSGFWRISGEDFMAPLQNLISDFKIRASYGATGNQEGIDDFGSLTQYAPGRNYNGQPGMAKSVVGNQDLRWETTKAVNLGIDLSFFNNRVNLITDFYIRRTEDLFYPLALPATTGFSAIPRVNLGDLENRGVEVMLSTNNLVGAFTWTTDFNIAFNRNQITYLIETGGSSDRVIRAVNWEGAEGPYGLFKVGQPVGNFYGFRYLGVWSSTEAIPTEWNPNPNSPRVRPGDVRFEDVDNNFIYQRIGDHMIIGNAIPKHTGGITNTFAYKGFDLNIVFNWSYGNQIYNMTRAVMESMAEEYNQLATVRDRWTPNNPTGSLPRAFYGASSTSGAANTDANSRFVEDGSFLRLRNVTFGYNIPAGVANRVFLNNVRVYVSGQNLLTFTNYTGLDPENQNIGAAQGGLPSLGVDFLTQPLPRVYILGINIGF